MILGVISPGMAFVVMIGVVVLFVVGLIASGILNVHIEIETDEQYEERKANREMIKERRRRERSERKRKK